MSHVAVLGAGSWGTALADLLARRGHAVRLWCFEPEVAHAITATRENPLYFPGARLANSLAATPDLLEALAGAEMVCSATPSHVTRRVWREAAPLLGAGTILVCATKGMETESLDLMHTVASEELPGATFVALSGPSFAQEVFEGQPTAVVAASTDRAAVIRTQEMFAGPTFRVYSNDDVVGVELGGSLKNTVAIAAGMLDGLGMRHNARAALLTRALAEMSRLGVALGARSDTFAGLAGMGDLILTCTGDLSRNRQLGIALAKGVSLAEYRASHRTVAEGVNTALAAARLADREEVEMPITQQVAAVLFDGASPRECLQALMERAPKAEQWG